MHAKHGQKGLRSPICDGVVQHPTAHGTMASGDETAPHKRNSLTQGQQSTELKNALTARVQHVWAAQRTNEFGNGNLLTQCQYPTELKIRRATSGAHHYTAPVAPRLRRTDTPDQMGRLTHNICFSALLEVWSCQPHGVQVRPIR